MPFTLTDLRADLDALLATAVDAGTWTNTLKDSGVRQALAVYSLHGPVYEEDVAVTLAGYEQGLAGLSGLLRVEALAWPWHEGERFEECRVRWRLVGPATVRLDRVAPQAGEILRVRFRRAHSVAGLDGASATTLPDAHRALLADGAASEMLALRLRQISENPALPREAAAQIEALHAGLRDRFEEALEGLQDGEPLPVWSGVGL